MKTTNTINNNNIRNINRIAEANLKKAIFAAAKENEPSAKQIARDQKRCAELDKRNGGKHSVIYRTWDWYKKLMENLRITNEYKTGKGRSRINIVESIFRLAEQEENYLYINRGRHDNYHKECMKLIAAAGLEAEYSDWKLARQVYDRSEHVIRVGDIIRFPDITEVCGCIIENGYESKVTVDYGGNVLIAYPENPWVEDGVLHVQGIPFTAELANRAEIIIRREEGFIRHPYDGFRLTCIEMPATEETEIFVKKS